MSAMYVVSQVVGGPGQQHRRILMYAYEMTGVPNTYLFDFTAYAQQSGFESNFIGYGIGNDKHPWHGVDCFTAIPSFIQTGQFANFGPIELGLAVQALPVTLNVQPV